MSKVLLELRPKSYEAVCPNCEEYHYSDIRHNEWDNVTLDEEFPKGTIQCTCGEKFEVEYKEN